MTSRAHIEAHRAAGRRFEAAGVGSFVRDHGEGEPIVLLHGVPASSFLYRKVLERLPGQGARGIAFDFPGLGLADRPPDYDYSWSGLARFTEAALDELGLDRVHLVVHDIGGPIGFEVAVRQPERIASLTALNTIADVATFHRPWSMHPFSIRGVGEVYLRTMTRQSFAALFYLQGIGDRSATERSEIYAYYDLLKETDGGRAFLKIMRGFELTREKQDFLWGGLTERPYPAQVVWGRDDPALGADRRSAVLSVLGLESATLLPGKHFFQEEQAPELASILASFAGQASTTN